MIKAIIYNDINEAQALIDKIDNAVRYMFKGSTQTYTYIIKHPDGDKFAVAIDMADVIKLQQTNPEIIDSIGVELIDSVIPLTDDWQPIDELFV